MDLFSGELVLALQRLILNTKECDDFWRPEKFIVSHIIAESFQVFDEADDLVGVLLAQRLHGEPVAQGRRLQLFEPWDFRLLVGQLVGPGNALRIYGQRVSEQVRLLD